MTNEPKLTESEKDFIAKSKRHFSEKAMKLVNEFLKPILLSRDLPILDIYYIVARSKQILEEKYRQIEFADPTILKLRKALLASTIAEAKERKVKKPEKDERAQRCEPVCRRLVEKVLDVDLLFSDEDYLKGATENDDALLLRIMVNGYMDHIDSWLEMLMRENFRKADKSKWDGKEREEITWKDIDNELLK